MEELLGKEVGEAPIYAGQHEGRILFYEKGLMYDCANINGKIYALYTGVMRVEAGKELPLGKMEMRLVLLSMLGEKFDLKVAISDQYYHLLREKTGR